MGLGVYRSSRACAPIRVTTPPVSVVVPTRNGMATLPDLLDRLRRQRVEGPLEIIAIDSASTDGSAELLRARADVLISIRADAFDHGLTRNAGIARARGELVVLVVQDALPASESWLAALTAPLLADPAVAGSFARQQPRDDASAVTRYYLSRWIAAADTPRTLAIESRSAFDALSPIDQFLSCAFDNVCSCVRRSVWEQHPFRSTPIGEDVEWAREVLLAGHRLVYAPDAVVVHSHDRSTRYEFERTYVLHRRLYELFRVRTIPSVTALTRAIASSMAIHLRCQRAAPGSRRTARDLGRALSLAVAWPLGQYLGALAAVRGWKPSRSSFV
jgi:GT2 family glycosyltransferase